MRGATASGADSTTRRDVGGRLAGVGAPALGPGRRRRLVWFIGDDAGGSAAVAALPRWAQVLGVPVDLRPVDVRTGADPGDYVRIFDEMVGNSLSAGAVITGHKVGLYASVGHRCRLSADARRLREINVLAIRNGGDLPAGHDGFVEGYATDVVSVGAAVDRIWPHAGGTVVCLGGGGSARALCRHLVRREARPGRVVVCERDEARASQLEDLFTGSERAAVGLRVLAGREQWDDVVAELEPGGLVVNATGLGKTDWQAPLSSGAAFPTGVTVWDLNYRGPLPFLRSARHQQAERGLVVVDGTELFALGWLAALGALFGLDGPERLAPRFLDVAREVTGGASR